MYGSWDLHMTNKGVLECPSRPHYCRTIVKKRVTEFFRTPGQMVAVPGGFWLLAVGSSRLLHGCYNYNNYN